MLSSFSSNDYYYYSCVECCLTENNSCLFLMLEHFLIYVLQAFGMTDAEHESLSEKVDNAVVRNSLIKRQILHLHHDSAFWCDYGESVFHSIYRFFCFLMYSNPFTAWRSRSRRPMVFWERTSVVWVNFFSACLTTCTRSWDFTCDVPYLTLSLYKVVLEEKWKSWSWSN